MTDEQFAAIIKRLDLIANLLIEELLEENASLTEKAVRLERLGLSSAEIGRLIGKTSSYVAATLSMHKKKKKPATERKKEEERR